MADRRLIADQRRPCACTKMRVDSVNGLPVSAEPGPAHDILVSRTSVSPKACNQVTGRWFGERRVEVLVELASSSVLQRTSTLSNNLRQNRTSAYEKMWSNAGFDYFRRLRSNIKLRRRSRSFLYGPGEVLSRRSCLHAISTPKLVQEERLRNFTSGLTAFNGMNRRRGSPSSSLRLRPYMRTSEHEQFHKPFSLCTLESPDGGYRNEVDYIIASKRFYPTDIAVVPKFYTGSDHTLLRERFSFIRRAEKAAKFRERNPRTTINWDLFGTLAGFWQDSAMDNIDEE
ncbi:hypothetical protein RB195_015216 [Necator americanus]|uniref:Uncharacterized protein n=1 Tax=Necator americanus TaxID=51031 RepID=A0ABR1E3I6_NECAM